MRNQGTSERDPKYRDIRPWEQEKGTGPMKEKGKGTCKGSKVKEEPGKCKCQRKKPMDMEVLAGDRPSSSPSWTRYRQELTCTCVMPFSAQLKLSTARLLMLALSCRLAQKHLHPKIRWWILSTCSTCSAHLVNLCNTQHFGTRRHVKDQGCRWP